MFNWTLTCCVEAQNQKEPVFELASWLFVQMASGGPEAPESPEQCAEAQPEEVAVVMSPESKVMRHALFAELGNMAMQLVCILDDMDDKFEDDPSCGNEPEPGRSEPHLAIPAQIVRQSSGCSKCHLGRVGGKLRPWPSS